jgi:hypothetical protein
MAGEDEQARETDLLRTEMSAEERTAPARLSIDPGLVHHRKIHTVLGDAALAAVDAQIASMPADLPDHLKQLRIDHLYTRALVAYCERTNVPSLGMLLAQPDPSGLWCSVEHLAPTPDIYGDGRVQTTIQVPGVVDRAAELEYKASRVLSDTVRGQLHQGDRLAVVAEVLRIEGERVVFHPLAIGGAWLTDLDGDSGDMGDLVWWSGSFGEVFVEDIDEFAAAKAVTVDGFEAMKTISESAFKQCLARLLGITAPKDWGGEQSDLYACDVHLRGQRRTAAFLLKGPARFAPMTLNSLGKNNDQIVRLSSEPADLLIVQHCHEINQAVRSTLRAFTIQPGTLRRRYCLIDGRDSMKILKAYDLVDEALAITEREKSARD